VLYVVATPIGNLDDLSARAERVLREVGTIAAEDTRETHKLLARIGTAGRLESFHAHSPPSRIDHLLALLEAGDDLALVTDAGTPGISDPGPALVARARARGIRVVPIPGPSAVSALLSASGLPGDQYWFAGFPPRKGKERAEFLDRVGASTIPVVCYEAPGRIAALVADLARSIPDRPLVLGRELTKVHEEILSLPAVALADLLANREVRGECSLVVAPAPVRPVEPDLDLAARLVEALHQAGIEGSRAARVVARVTGLSRNRSYDLMIEQSRADGED